MKKIYGFLGALALLTMASCSKDVESGAPAPEVKGDMYMSMSISQKGMTRTATPDQGEEIGKDFENKVADALIIFAKKNEQGEYIVFNKGMHVGEIAGASPSYTATWEMDRKTIADDIAAVQSPESGEKSVTYAIFVVANPNQAMIDKFTATTANGKNVQDVFELTADGNGATSYWENNHFLMSNAELLEKTIKESDVVVPKHNVSGDPLDLGTVKIQRAMSRFDIDVDTNNVTFTTSDDQSALKDITFFFDGFALINEASMATIYKVTSEKGDGVDGIQGEYTAYDKAKTLGFRAETATNYVFSPVQTSFLLPLFNGTVSNGAYPANTPSVDLGSLTYTRVEEIQRSLQDETFTHPGQDQFDEQGAYRIWRYCMENTNYDKDNQLHGNSTGIVLRARMTSTSDKLKGKEGVFSPIYAFGNVFIGDAEDLRSYVINPKSGTDNTGIYELAVSNYKTAVEKYNTDETVSNSPKFTFEEDKTGTGDWTAPEGSELANGYKDIRKATAAELAKLDTYLVGTKKFAIYRPSKVQVKKEQPSQEGALEYEEVDGYYCYYIYWNRHNDNDKITEMGPMEFATVRNNVYKIKINSVSGLGHPGKPDDDPDKPKPEDPDEKDHFYISIECKILPWEVRLNGLDL